MSVKSFRARVVTYNVLSSSLAPPSAYPNVLPAFLDPAFRWRAVSTKLLEECSASSILALQEMSLIWSGAMVALCQQHNYTYIPAHYGNRKNGYMGVGIAVPNAKFDVLDCSIVKISESRSWPCPPRTPTPLFLAALKWPLSFVASTAGFLWRELGLQKAWTYFFPKRREDMTSEDVWKEVMTRANEMVSVRLRDKGTGGTLCVSVYHMPCIFWSPTFMLIHAALAAGSAKAFAGGDPHMLVGDFNFTPDSAAYRLFTTGSVADCDKALFPKPPPYGSEKDLSFLNLSQPLRSAYVLARGREPEFTNYSESAWGGSFSGTLDFLFTSDDRIVVTSVDDLPALADSKPLPNETAPSDHVPVAADVEVVFQP